MILYFDIQSINIQYNTISNQGFTYYYQLEGCDLPEKKQGKEMTKADVKRCRLKNLSILKAREILLNKTDLFIENWNIFITELRADIYTSNSWYTI